MKIVRYLILIAPIVLISCQNNNLKYTKIFDARLGFEENEIGSNVPILENYTNRSGFTDNLLVDVPKFYIRDQKVYVADLYNKRVNIFNMGKFNLSKDLELSIPNTGENYSFARPYEIYVDRYENIYVLASVKDFESYEVQNYSNQTAAIQNYEQFQKDLKNIPAQNFYIYKFSSQGEFLYRLGNQGINTKPMAYPIKISGDDFGNIYVTFPVDVSEKSDRMHLAIKRFSNIGDPNFEFHSKTINISTNINDINYQGNVLSINNFQHDEQLAVLIEYQPTTNNKSEKVIQHIDNIWSSVNMYSLLANNFTQEIFKNKNITESILDIDKYGYIFFQSYDEKTGSLKLRRLNTHDGTEEIYYTPIHSTYYVLFDYFIDYEGNIYNYLVDRQNKVIILQWKIEESE